MPHLKLGPPQKLSTYRKIAIASWRHPRDPTTYSWLELPVGPAEAFLKTYPADVRPSMTHFVTKLVAHALERNPQFNQVLRAGNLYPRTQTDIYLTTLTKGKGGYDLSGFTLNDVPNRTLGEIAALSKDAGEVIRKGEDAVSKRTDEIVGSMPTWLVSVTAAIQDFFHFGLNVSLATFGIPDDRFGSAIISNFGVLGLENGLVPLSPYCRCPLIVGIGKSRLIPVVEKGAVVAAECVTISFTFDHRYADGAHGARMMRHFQKVFTDPARYAHVFERAAPGESGAGDD